MSDRRDGVPNDGAGRPADDLVRRERVVDTVMARIAAAPPAVAPMRAPSPVAALPIAGPPPWADFAPWRVPALAAATAVLVASAAVMAKVGAEGLHTPASVAESLGLPTPVAHWLETGESPPLGSLGALGGRP